MSVSGLTYVIKFTQANVQVQAGRGPVSVYTVTPQLDSRTSNLESYTSAVRMKILKGVGRLSEAGLVWF